MRKTFYRQVVKVIWHKAPSPPHKDSSIVFARLRQRAPHLVHPIDINRTVPVLPPSESLWVYRPPGMSRASHFAFKIALHVWGSGSQSHTWFLGPTRVHAPNGISVGSAVFGRPFAKRFALCYRTVGCPVCLTVTLVYRGQTSGWIKIPVAGYRGRPRPRRHYVTWGPSSPKERGTAPPLFGPCLMWPNGRPSQQLLSCCCTAHGRESLYFTLRLTISAFVLAW